MTIAWYGHLKYRRVPLFTVIVVSWLIAFVEYCFQVPANRIGYGQFSGFQLKIIQEVITLCVFTVFAWLYLGEVTSDGTTAPPFFAWWGPLPLPFGENCRFHLAAANFVRNCGGDGFEGICRRRWIGSHAAIRYARGAQGCGAMRGNGFLYRLKCGTFIRATWAPGYCSNPKG